MMDETSDQCDFIVVGSGAGGGPLAANLARAGYHVVLFEAGGDDGEYDYKVPAFHAKSTENQSMAWDYWVRHYSTKDKSERGKLTTEDGKRLYPRAGTLGGCTAHNALVTVCPADRDWDYIAAITGDASWSARNMREYFQRLEKNRYRWFVSLRNHRMRHGLNGWLSIDRARSRLVLKDKRLLRLLIKSVWTAYREIRHSLLDKIWLWGDPNDWRNTQNPKSGFFFVPMTTQDGSRVGPRDYIHETQQHLDKISTRSSQSSGRLDVRTHRHVCKVVLDKKRAIGVEYASGKRLFEAYHEADTSPCEAPRRTTYARHEVVLAAGAFNTPQLLMLSGIGPKAHLQEHNIDAVHDLKGVGENLQDRYEVTQVLRLKHDITLLDDASFTIPEDTSDADPHALKWKRKGKGVYTTNGALFAFMRRSTPQKLLPDLFVFGLAGEFHGYAKGWSDIANQHQDRLTIAVLKAYTNNTAGKVRLKSASPFAQPDICFNYFEDGNDSTGDDLESVLEGLKFARKIASNLTDYVSEEISPGKDVKSDDDLRDYIRANAWGHHASCSCKMGPTSDDDAVVDSEFRVHGIERLRVVDASVFPKIPGYFIVMPTYIISEKAYHIIALDARNRQNDGSVQLQSKT